MWWRRSRVTPWWVWLLALLGIRSLWLWRERRSDPNWAAKRHQFKQKIDEAFDVWRQDDDSEEPSEAPPQPEA